MTAEKVADFAGGLPFLFGPNYVSANCGSQLQFWSSEGFDPKIIDVEMALAETLGINTLRVFLHDLHFTHDPRGLAARVDEFLNITAAHGIKPMFVLFDSCWDPEPKLGHYPAPIPGRHNSRWVQSPGNAILRDTKLFAALQPYVEWYASEVAGDPRALPIADLWNEPDNEGGRETGSVAQQNRAGLVAPHLLNVFKWARGANADIFLTSGLWGGDAYEGLERGAFNDVQIVQRACSDLPSFHCYENEPWRFEKLIDLMEIDDEGYKRPVLCSEWMQRGSFQPGHSNSIASLLPMQKERLIGSMPWGLVTGDTQTDIPWSGVMNGIPHHDLFDRNRKLYYPEEGAIIRKIMEGETFAARQISAPAQARQMLMRPPREESAKLAYAG